MLRWLLVVLLALLVFGGLQQMLARFGFGRLPGDLRFTFRGKERSIPLASTVLLSLIAMAIGELI